MSRHTLMRVGLGMFRFQIKNDIRQNFISNKRGQRLTVNPNGQSGRERSGKERGTGWSDLEFYPALLLVYSGCVNE